MNTNNILAVEELEIQVERKNIKHTHLSVYPPYGRIHISAPEEVPDNDIRSFVVSKIDWIRQQREEIELQNRQTTRQYITGETHYLFGKGYYLIVHEQNAPPTIECKNGCIFLTVRPDASIEKKEKIFHQFYREELDNVLQQRYYHWLDIMNETNVPYTIKLMHTKWGSCIEKKRSIIFSLLLARVPLHCIDYVIVHELSHLKFHRHNNFFEANVYKYLPNWQHVRDELNEFILLPYEGE